MIIFFYDIQNLNLPQSINWIYPALVLFERSNFIDWINVLLYMVTDKDIVFLVPDSCRMTVRNSNRISAKLHRGHHQKRLEQHLFLLIIDNLAVVLEFLTLGKVQ